MRAALSILVAALVACGESEERAQIEPERAPSAEVSHEIEAPEAPTRVREAPPIEAEAPAPTPEPVVEAPSPPPEPESEDEDEADEETLAPLAGRLAQGPLRDDAHEAALAGLAGTDDAEYDAEVTYRRDTFFLARTLERAAQRDERARWSVYLVRVRANGEQFRREAGASLYEFAIAGDDVDCSDAPLGMGSELRARDVDGDGEVEITVIVAAAATPVRGGSYDPMEECGLVAFIVGGNDLDVQARFTRRHHLAQLDAGGELFSRLDTTWRLEDVNGDGRADLRVTEAYRYSFDFMGDDIGDGETAGPEHDRRANRRSMDCLYDVATDRYTCPMPYGQSLFRDRATVMAGGRLQPPEW